MVALLPADVAEGSVVRDVLGDVGDLVDRMVVLEDLQETKRGQNSWSHSQDTTQTVIKDEDSGH